MLLENPSKRERTSLVDVGLDDRPVIRRLLRLEVSLSSGGVGGAVGAGRAKVEDSSD
jgi:hypothetical protein